MEATREELLRLDGLSVDYPVRGGWLSAVSDLSVTLYRGEIYALVGESGCGKSTVAYAVTRLLPGTERMTGGIYFHGEDLTRLSRARMEKVRGRGIGMVFQNPLDSLNPVYTAGRQVSEAIELDGVSRQDALPRAVRLFRDVRMPDAEKRARSYPHELSGGMRQRVMIAMMLGRDPDLLIADEPTTALDVSIEAQILSILLDLKNARGASVLLITHNFGVVAETADRIGVMYAGELIEEGSARDIFNRPAHPYTRLLMRALPRASKAEGRLETIDGSVPSFLNAPRGCRFSNRCPYSADACVASKPPSRTLQPGHTYRCYREEAI
ncbi:MAG: ABC transporter ATP-binding protein [Oscillospiraceae bacterium]|jgi:oligopeptide/dipeptide ABC transporter ATP-binding protein|nr:ABC transporter ATP-binding protein [Oscillospiraceae bacterium]